MKDLTDAQLVERIRTGDQSAMEEVFRRYYPQVCQAVYRILPRPAIVEDIAQDLFFSIWHKRKDLRITSNLAAYLKRGAVNRTLNHIRDNRILESGEDHFPRIVDETEGVAKAMEARELQERINRLIDALPPKCRAIFMLSRFEELSYKEIAEKLDLSVKTVENQVSRALKFLREHLKDHFPD